MSTPRLPTYVKNQSERRERSMQTAFPAKVISWSANLNVVKIEPQFIETWVNQDGSRESEPNEYPYLENVPVLFPRSGNWSITFPIETGSYGLVICTKFALDVWREQGRSSDPGDLRRFGMSGAVFHPVNLHPNSSAISGVSSTAMELGNGTTQFVALANLVRAEFVKIATTLATGTVAAAPGDVTFGTEYTAPTLDSAVGSATVKVSQ